MAERNVTPGRVPVKMTPKMIIIVLIVVIGAVLLLNSFYSVDAKEQAVILTFGRFSRITGPGLHTKIPFIEKNYNVPTKEIRTMQFGYRTAQPGVNTVYSNQDFPEESIMLTGDLNIVDVEWNIQYQIIDPTAWLFNVQERDKTIRDVSQSVINQLVGDRTIFDVLGQERANIELQSREMMNETLKNYKLGININQVKLQNIVPPAGEVQDAFEDVNKAQQDYERLINEGKEAYNKEIPRARGQANQIIQNAEGYAARRKNTAEGDTARFIAVLKEYRQAPEITRTRLYYETMETLFSAEEATELIDGSLENFLPLKQLGGQQ